MASTKSMSVNDGDRLRVATNNVHGCVGMDRRRSETRIAEAIADLEVDVIGLQELDLNRRRSAGIDQAGLIAEQLGWQRIFHPALRVAGEQYGDAILSRWPMQLRQARELPSVTTRVCPETRAAIWVEIQTPAGPVQVINTHLGLGRRERFMQAQLLIGDEWLGSVVASYPLILMGDFNSLPGSAPYRLIVQQLRDARRLVTPAPHLRAYPTRLPLFAVDHIFVNEQLHVERIRVVRNARTRVASDHFPVVADLRQTAKIQRAATPSH
jgi:endonuclease/exonuclease/phosphatase family metal-dependent hydrolase